MDQRTYDQMAPALHPVVKKQPGFIIHVAYATSEGFAVGEVWETKEQHEAWFNENIAPNLPSGDGTSVEYTDLHAVVRP
jgi:heme-degrading monooxygenase HmoA